MKKLVIVILTVCTTLIFYIIEAPSKIDLFIFTLKKPMEWSIGVYWGQDPFHLHPMKGVNNPVLTAQDVSDVPADFVADPFIFHEGNKFYMFFEVLNSITSQGDIGLAVSRDGLNWTYRQIVLDETFHLSYPYVFKLKNQYYMIPESHEANAIRLYKAEKFPTKWSFVSTLRTGIYLDPTPFRYNDKWWIFAGGGRHDTLYLFYSDTLTGSWKEHPMSPIVRKNPNIAQPAGRILILENRIIRYAQDDDPIYGNRLRAFEISVLTTSRYLEHEIMMNPILKGSGFGWNADGMHHIDYHRISKKSWIAIADGFRLKKIPRFSLK